MLEETTDREEIIERVAALDIGKAELVCCVRVPGAEGKSRRVQEVSDLPDDDPSIAWHGRPAHRAGGGAGGDGGDQ